MTEPFIEQAGKSKLKLEFTDPYHPSATHFIFTRPQPIYSLKLLVYIEKSDIVAVDDASYLSCDKPEMIHADPPKPRDISYEVSATNSWVHPTSGVTFVWQNPD
jgi:hypothetical protein